MQSPMGSVSSFSKSNALSVGLINMYALLTDAFKYFRRKIFFVSIGIKWKPSPPHTCDTSLRMYQAYLLYRRAFDLQHQMTFRINEVYIFITHDLDILKSHREALSHNDLNKYITMCNDPLSFPAWRRPLPLARIYIGTLTVGAPSHTCVANQDRCHPLIPQTMGDGFLSNTFLVS